MLWTPQADGRIAPNLSAVEVMSGDGVGMVRQCSLLDGREWKETCTGWDEGHSYSFDIDKNTYPFPIETMTGEWSVDDHGQGSRITMRFRVEPTDHPASRQFVRMLKSTFGPTLESILDAWQEEAEAASAA
jgi:hypothetical protein